MPTKAEITIATRKSPLALWQANYVRAQLRNLGVRANLLELTAAGDRITDAPRATSVSKGLFLKELEQALQQGAADIAVHSMKDVPAELPAGLGIAAICRRADARDALVAAAPARLQTLPAGAAVGTGSLRRQSQLRARFPRLRFADIRGNINTRLDKLARGQFDALVLAAAGLRRLRLTRRIGEYLPVEICLPAVGQGAIGIECRLDDAAVRAVVAPLNHADSAVCVAAERAAAARLGGGCQLPLAVYAELDRDQIHVRGVVGARDGSRLLRGARRGPRAAATDIGRAVGDELLAQGGRELML